MLDGRCASGPGRAHYLVVLNVARSDGFDGLFGGDRARARRAAARSNGLQAALGAMKRLAERR